MKKVKLPAWLYTIFSAIGLLFCKTGLHIYDDNRYGVKKCTRKRCTKKKHLKIRLLDESRKWVDI